MRKNCETCKHDDKDYPRYPFKTPCNECVYTGDVPNKWEAAEHYVPDTNADRIRAMSDEELADFLEKCECSGYNDSTIAKDKFDRSMDMLEWLKQPSEEETQTDCTYNKNGHCIGQKLMPECDAKNCDRRK